MNSPLGELVAGGYAPGDDGRAWGDLRQAERFEVIAAFYRRLHDEIETHKRRLEAEAALIASLEPKSARTARMDEIRTSRPQEFERVRRAVIAAYSKRIAEQ